MIGRDFPRLAEYVARLPEGLRSFPECRAKASLLRALLEARGDRPLPGAGPPELLNLLSEPPTPNVWISEVHFVAIHYLLADTDRASEKEVIEMTYRASRSLTESRMYSALAKVASPGIMFRGAVTSWGLIHRGVRLTAKSTSGHASAWLLHPPHLYPRVAHVSAGEGFRAVIEAANGQAVVVTLRESRPDGAEYEARWT
jgi:hypothetical protein